MPSLMRIKGNPSPSASRAIPFVLSLIREHNIDPDDIEGIRKRKDDIAAAKEAGRRLTPTPVDRLIVLLEAPSPAETTPEARVSTPTRGLPTQPETLGASENEEITRRAMEYFATMQAQMAPEPVAR